MRKITPLVISGASSIGKSAFASRLVNEHPDLFKLSTQKIDSITQTTEKDQRIPVL